MNEKLSSLVTVARHGVWKMLEMLEAIDLKLMMWEVDPLPCHYEERWDHEGRHDEERRAAGDPEGEPHQAS